MSQENELRPCPLCGGVAEWEYKEWNEETETGDDGTGLVECRVCGLKLFGHDREDAERRWNARTPPLSNLTLAESMACWRAAFYRWREAQTEEAKRAVLKNRAETIGRRIQGRKPRFMILDDVSDSGHNQPDSTR